MAVAILKIRALPCLLSMVAAAGTLAAEAMVVVLATHENMAMCLLR